MKTGFIGLGDQGGAMAEMILAGARPLSVWTRRAEASEPFRSRGADVAATAAELAASVDLLCICVTDDAAVLQVVIEQNVLEAMRPGAVLAIHSTVQPPLCERLSAAGDLRGITVLDAPVSGSGTAARSRSLVMMVGGPESALERCRAVFASHADPILHMGGSGSGMRAKLLHNLLAASNIGAAISALEASRSLGLDPSRLRAAMLKGTARSFGVDAVVRLQNPQRARHILPLLRKDIDLARHHHGAAPLDDLFSLAETALQKMQGWSEGDPALVESVS